MSDIRSRETRVMEKAAMIQNFSMTISPIIPVLATMFTFLMHTWLRLPLSTSNVSYTPVSDHPALSISSNLVKK